MKFYATALLALLPLALAAKSLKSVIVTFPKGTPSSVIAQAKDSLVAAVRLAFSIYIELMTNMSCRGVSLLMNTVSPDPCTAQIHILTYGLDLIKYGHL